LLLRGLLRARSRFPEIVENIENRGQRMESLECPNALAKQVLSQLSYTPTDSAISLMDFLWRRPVAFSAGALARRSYIRLGASPCFDLRMN
jgi:hypothetical protein